MNARSLMHLILVGGLVAALGVAAGRIPSTISPTSSMAVYLRR